MHIFNVEIMGRVGQKPLGLRYGDCVASSERQAMMKSKNVVSALRRDAGYVLNAAIASVFIGFAVLAVAAALFDLLPIRH
jgi:hypothetical protein